MTDGQPCSAGYFIGICVARYDDDSYKALDAADAAMQSLETVLAKSGYTGQVLQDPTYAEVSTALTAGNLSLTDFKGPLVLAWTGHGESVGDELKLLVKDSKPGVVGLTHRPKDLASFAWAAGSRDTLFIIDTCSSGEGDADVILQAIRTENTSTAPGGARPQLSVLVSCKAYEPAVAGAFLHALIKLLTNGPNPDDTGFYKPCWTNKYEFVPVGAINFVLANSTIGRQEPRSWNSGGSKIAFRNPFFDPTATEDLVADTLSSEASPDMLTIVTPAMTALAGRVGEPRPGLWLLLGEQGTGKSTSMAWVAATADATLIDASVGAAAVTEALATTDEARAILIDGFDAAAARDLETILDKVLLGSRHRFVALSSRPGALAVVEPGPAGRGLLGAERVLDLADSAWRSVIERYVVERLRAAA